jgi:hypothetical protein
MQEHFITEDAVLAAVILSLLNIHIISVDRENTQSPKFTFPQKDIIEEFVEAYERGDLRVEPVIFSLTLASLADRIEGNE